MVGCAVRNEPTLLAGITHGNSFIHVSGHITVTVPESGETVPHSGLYPGGPECLIDHQCLTVGHGGLLDLCQPLSKGEHAGDDILIAAQPGAELPGVVVGFPCNAGNILPVCSLEDAAAAVGQVVGDAGNNVRQIDEDMLLIHPAGFPQLAAFPGGHTAATVNGEANLDPIAAVVSQDGEGDRLGTVRGGDRHDLSPTTLSVVDLEWETGAVPAGGPGDVDFKIASRGIGSDAAGHFGRRSLCGKSGGREHPHDGDGCQQAGQGALPVGLDALGERFQHMCGSSFISL